MWELDRDWEKKGRRGGGINKGIKKTDEKVGEEGGEEIKLSETESHLLSITMTKISD